MNKGRFYSRDEVDQLIARAEALSAYDQSLEQQRRKDDITALVPIEGLSEEVARSQVLELSGVDSKYVDRAFKQASKLSRIEIVSTLRNNGIPLSSRTLFLVYLSYLQDFLTLEFAPDSISSKKSFFGSSYSFFCDSFGEKREKLLELELLYDRPYIKGSSCWFTMISLYSKKLLGCLDPLRCKLNDCKGLTELDYVLHSSIKL